MWRGVGGLFLRLWRGKSTPASPGMWPGLRLGAKDHSTGSRGLVGCSVLLLPSSAPSPFAAQRLSKLAGFELKSEPQSPAAPSSSCNPPVKARFSQQQPQGSRGPCLWDGCCHPHQRALGLRRAQCLQKACEGFLQLPVVISSLHL